MILIPSEDFSDIAGLFPNCDFRYYFGLAKLFIPGSRELEKWVGVGGGLHFPIFNETYIGFH